MFIRKYKFIILEALVGNLQEENNKLKSTNRQLKEENSSLRHELEDEHLENYNQHRKLLRIEQLANKPYVTYKDLLEFKNNIKELVQDYQSQN